MSDVAPGLDLRPVWYDRAVRAALCVWFLALAAVLIDQLAARLGEPLGPLGMAGLISYACSIVFVFTILGATLLRPIPLAKAPGWRPRLAALLGSYLIYGIALLPRSDIGTGLHILSATLMLGGNALALLVLLNLGRSFSIMAEARQLVTDGPYAIVRHPLYLAEQIGLIGLFFQVASWPAFVLLAAQTYFQIERMRNEEAVLARAFPDYAAYAARTARFIPLVW